MKEKILAQLKKKYVGVSTSFLGLLADKLSAKVTEETQIEGVIDELEKSGISIVDLDKFHQTEGDRRATEAAATREAKLKEQFNLVSKTPTPPKKEDGDDPVDKKLEAMQKKIADFESKDAQQKFKKNAVSKLKDKKIPEAFYRELISSRNFQDDAEIETFVTSVETGFNEVQQEFIDAGLSAVAKPVFGKPGSDGVSPALKSFIAEKTSDGSSNPLGAKKL